MTQIYPLSGRFSNRYLVYVCYLSESPSLGVFTFVMIKPSPMSSLRQQFLQHVAQTSSFPLMLEIDRAEGLYLYDPSGKAYLDLISGIGVSSLGHRHPAVVQAVKDQADRYMHTIVYGEFVLAPQVEMAELMARHLPDSLNSVYFVNSGSEATEGAMKLAKRHTGRREIIACREAYHGSTQGAASLMAPTTFTQAYYPLLPGIRHIDYNDFEDLEKINEQTAAVIVETVRGESGVQLAEKGYLQALRKRCTEVGALLILDEVQAGFGRTGKLFAFEHYDIIPDILTLGKAMGGGMPIGAFVADQELMRALSVDPLLGHITTFGGHPVICAAAKAGFKALLESDLIKEVPRKEALFRELLVHPKIKEVRSKGLMMAVELSGFAFLEQVIKYCLANGLITDWFLFNDRSLRIAPPLIIEEPQIRWACKTILEGIDQAV